MTRRLAAFMFTDLVESTQLAQREEKGALQLLREQESFTRPILEARRGRLARAGSQSSHVAAALKT